MFSNVWRAAREHPRSFAMLAVTFLCISIAGSSAGSFAPKYLQEVHGWLPAQVATLNLIGGALAIVGNPLGGWLSDRFGRRPTGTDLCARLWARDSRVLFVRRTVHTRAVDCLHLLFDGYRRHVIGVPLRTVSHLDALVGARAPPTSSPSPAA